jgi:glutamate synthase (NADPH/NADH) small chain
VKADLVLLAMGFVHPVHEGLIKTLGLDLDPRGNVKADTEKYQTSNPKIFTAGDMRRGQSIGGVGDPRGPSGRARGR